ncbi:MAG: helix-turn-helix domain-containing protein [Chitinophagaceae bacterium]
MSTIIQQQKQRVKEIMAEAEQKITTEIGRPVNLLYKIKVNHMNPQLIIQQVLAVCGVTYGELVSKSHEQRYVVPRRIVMWLTTYYCGLSDTEVGKLINRDRSTVSHGIVSMNDSLDVQDDLYIVPLKQIETQLLQITNAA